MAILPRFYVYVLARPNDKVFYVGKGQGKRIFKHDDEAKSGHKCHKCNVIRKIWKQGDDYQRYVVFTTDNEQEAHDYERELIAMHGRDNLCNLTDGGEGCSGRIVSEETRRKMSERFKGRKGTRLGMSNSPEHRRKIGEANKGRQNTPEAIERMRQKLTGRKRSPEAIEKTRQKAIGRKMSPEFGAKISERQKGRVVSEEQRRKISETLKATAPWKGKHHTPESIQKMREIHSARADLKAKDYEGVSPDGEVFQIHNLQIFCNERNFRYSSIQRVFRTGKTYRGWRFRRL